MVKTILINLRGVGGKKGGRKTVRSSGFGSEKMRRT